MGNTTLLPGGAYTWRLNGVEAGPHTQSLLSSSGALDLTGLSAASRFVITHVTLTVDVTAGTLTDFNSSTTYTWTLGTYSGGITGFAADKFTVGQSENNLLLTFTPVPEPAAMFVVAGCVLVAAGRRFGRRAV